MAAPLHPDCITLLELIEAAGRPRAETLDHEAARRQYAAGRTILQPPAPDVAEARPVEGPGGLRMRLYRPLGSPAEALLPCLIFAHGGGWVFGDLDTHDHLARSLANVSDCAVLAVDYRLAPEHPFPAALEDYAAGIRHAVAHAAELGIDSTRLAVGGDSAGGNLAAVAALMARDGALPPLRFQMLLYPVTDFSQTQDSYARFTERLPLTSATMRWFREHYAPPPEDWRASPLRAATLAGTAPAFVLTVAHDPLCDEGRDYTARLEREGVRVTHWHASDMLHGALTMAAIIRPAMTLIAAAGLALRQEMT